MGDRRIEYVRLDELARAERNPKAHDHGTIRASVRRFGYAGSLIIDERTGRLVAGHGRLEALEQLAAADEGVEQLPDGLRRADDGAWLVPVERGWASADDDDAEAFLIAHNHAQEAGGWDRPELGGMLDEMARRRPDALDGTGFTRASVDELLAATRPTPPSDPPVPLADPDAIPEQSPEPITQPGDLWQLGPHRLLCADTFTPEHVDQLLAGELCAMVLTDPPYAIYGSATGIGSDIADDKMVRPFFEAAARVCWRVVHEFGHVYVHCDWRSYPALWDAAKRAKLSPKNALVWDKGGAGLGSNYANTYELVAFFSKLPPPTAMTSSAKRGQRSVFASNVLRYNRPMGKERHHNAAKPVAMLEQIIRLSSDPGDRVFDGFAGSGSTIVAAHLAGRVASAMEVEPSACDVIVRRFEAVTGIAPQRIAQAVT